MCGRYVIVTKVKEVEKRFNVQAGSEAAQFSPRYNLGPGSSGLVITDKDPHRLQVFTFGYTPFWSKKRLYIFNARAEGDKNKDNDPAYKGAREIFLKPMFRHSIRTKRCLIPADAFIEGPEKEKLSKPYVVYLREKQRPFAFAGVWDEWVNKETGEVHHGYAIITTTSNPGHPASSIPRHSSQGVGEFLAFEGIESGSDPEHALSLSWPADERLSHLGCHTFTKT